jgi:GYF domain 2
LHDQAVAEQWIIQVLGRDYGPADLSTLREWKADGRVLPENPARRADQNDWINASEIPGLFQIEVPPIQRELPNQQLEIRNQKREAKPPSRNILIETFRIYFRGFFQFLGLSLLSIVPIVCAALTSRFIDAAPGVNGDLRTLVAGAFGLCMIVLRIVMWPIYVAGVQILSAELATGQRISFLSVINGAVKYWPRVAGLCIFVYLGFGLLLLFGFGIVVMEAASNSLVSVVLALGLLVLQVWLFCRFFIKVLFWQQFAVLENANAGEALRESQKLAHSGVNLLWYQRPLWRGALIFSLWFAFALAVAIVSEWTVLRDYVVEISQTQDPQMLLQKMTAAMQTRGFDYQALTLNVLQQLLRPLLGIAFVVLYLDSKREV